MILPHSFFYTAAWSHISRCLYISGASHNGSSSKVNFGSASYHILIHLYYNFSHWLISVLPDMLQVPPITNCQPKQIKIKSVPTKVLVLYCIVLYCKHFFKQKNLTRCSWIEPAPTFIISFVSMSSEKKCE